MHNMSTFMLSSTSITLIHVLLLQQQQPRLNKQGRSPPRPGGKMKMEAAAQPIDS
jgi:hypothetical protein